MSHRLASSSLGCFLLLALFPLCARAAPKDSCKQLQRDLDQQIDDLKAWQKLDLQGCYRISGSNSGECRRLKDRHAQDLRSFRDNRAYQMANCRGYRTPSVAAASPLENSNHDFYDNYYSNRGTCVEYPYVNCEQYDHYVHAKLHRHHHHPYSDSPYDSAKPASAGADKLSPAGAHGNAGKNAKQDAPVNGGSSHEYPAQPVHRGTDRDNFSHRSSGYDNSPNHGSGRSDSSSTAASGHSRGSGGAGHSASSHVPAGSSDSHASSSSPSSSSSGASHSSGGSGSPSGSSSSGASHSGSTSSGGSGPSVSTPASSSSHDSGGSRPK